MFEAFLGVYLWIIACVLALAGICLASWTLFEIRRCRRVDFYNIVQLLCAGSAFALALQQFI